MGRKKKYVTKQQKFDAKQRDNKNYYQRNKERIGKKRMDDYWRRKEMDEKLS